MLYSNHEAFQQKNFKLPEYTKITPHCPDKSRTFMDSKIVFFFFHQKGT
jgi:hypothetical protein